jgi:hypothetical protein
MTMGRRAQAIAAFRQALRLEPDLAGVKERLRLAQHPARNATAKTAAPARAAVSADPRLFSNEAEPTRSD